MAISDHARKLLWGKSANRCSICRVELTKEENANDVHSIIGDECHIISKAINGPRYHGTTHEGLDDYPNLILLCKNHHKEIDDHSVKYNAISLHEIKKKHIDWVARTLSSANRANTEYEQTKDDNELLLLTHISNGKEQMDISLNSMAFLSEYQDADSEEEIEAIGSYLQNFKDWSDIIRDIEVGERISATISMSKDLQSLERLGFLVFGKIQEARFRTSKSDFMIMKIAVISILKKDNSAIMVNGEIKGTFVIVPKWVKEFTA